VTVEEKEQQQQQQNKSSSSSNNKTTTTTTNVSGTIVKLYYSVASHPLVLTSSEHFYRTVLL
jgi:hypothetical protein